MRHLTIDTLIQFAEDRLSPRNKRAVEQHIASCPACFAEASEWVLLFDLLKQQVLESPPKDATRNCFAIYQIAKPASKARRLFATALFDSALCPIAAGVRGPGGCRQIVFRVAEIDVHLRIGGKPQVILGQILQRKPNRFLDGVPVSLSQAGRRIEATITDTLGEFRFGTAPAGALRLNAELPSGRLVGDFTIKDEEINLLPPGEGGAKRRMRD
jgi:hypothetical protein